MNWSKSIFAEVANMKDKDKTKKQILSELMKLRQRVAELEVSENNPSFVFKLKA